MKKCTSTFFNNGTVDGVVETSYTPYLLIWLIWYTEKNTNQGET